MFVIVALGNSTSSWGCDEICLLTKWRKKTSSNISVRLTSTSWSQQRVSKWKIGRNLQLKQSNNSGRSTLSHSHKIHFLKRLAKLEGLPSRSVNTLASFTVHLASRDVLLLATPPFTFATGVNIWQFGLCIFWSITHTFSPDQWEKGRAREPEAVTGSECWIGRADADARGKTGYSFRWNRGWEDLNAFCVAAKELTMFLQLLRLY